MTNPFQAAMRRAAVFNPAMQVMHLYTRATDTRFNRPMPDTFDFTESVRGVLRWRDLDEVSNLGGGDVGDGVAVLVAPVGAIPDLIQTADGAFLLVKGAAGRDGLGMTTKVAVARWTEATPPTVRGTP